MGTLATFWPYMFWAYCGGMGFLEKRAIEKCGYAYESLSLPDTMKNPERVLEIEKMKLIQDKFGNRFTMDVKVDETREKEGVVEKANAEAASPTRKREEGRGGEGII